MFDDILRVYWENQDFESIIKLFPTINAASNQNTDIYDQLLSALAPRTDDSIDIHSMYFLARAVYDYYHGLNNDVAEPYHYKNIYRGCAEVHGMINSYLATIKTQDNALIFFCMLMGV